jgi:hypothetical protein
VRTGFGLGLAFAVARAGFAVALARVLRAAFVVLCIAGRLPDLGVADRFFFAGAFALAAGFGARFGLAREDGFLLLVFAMCPCFPSSPRGAF